MTTATAQRLDEGAAVERLRLTYHLNRHQRTSVIRRESDAGAPVVTGMATGAFPDAIDAALNHRP